MTVNANLVEELRSLLGNDYVVEKDDQLTISPANTHEVSAILRYANTNQITVSPAGGGTKRAWGNPTKTDIRVELGRLNRVVAHPWQDLTCTVQAGCTWQHLEKTLAKHGQFVALDPLWPERATVGGILATNDSGVLRHRYGSLRDLVIGMTIVLADGTIARSGGRVVKNVAGYDLCKLLTGSLGTLAVITEATFRLHPLPQHAQTFTVSAPKAAQLAPLMASIRGSQLLTQALQLRGNSDGFQLDIQLNCHPEAEQDEILKKMTESAGFKLESAANDVWLARENISASKDAFIAKIGMLPTDVAQIADDVVRLGGDLVAQSLGVIYVAFPNIKRDYSSLGSLYAYTDAGSMTVIQTPSNSLDQTTPPWGADQPNPLMQAVKKQFDPNNTLNSL